MARRKKESKNIGTQEIARKEGGMVVMAYTRIGGGYSCLTCTKISKTHTGISKSVRACGLFIDRKCAYT